MSSDVLLSRRSAFQRVLAIGLAASPLAFAQERKRISPHETVSEEVGGKKLSITYGRPSLKGRKMLGGQDPYGKVWRLGADEATKLTVSSRVTMGGDFTLEPGSYGLFAIPNPDHWTMIVNKVADQWGAFTYDQTQDVGRFDLKVKHLSTPVEEFTITLSKEGSSAIMATFAWGDASVSTQFKFV
jgi:hypothetical protein